VFTVATEPTDGYTRYIRSARVYDIEVRPLLKLGFVLIRAF